MNAHTKSIVVDLHELAALRRSRVAAPADEYMSKLISLRALATPVDFRLPLVLPDRPPTFH